MNSDTPNPVTTTLSGRSRKLRASCDRCSASKVKCGQERPACLRCVNSSRPCNYSVSRRLGKPPASDRHRPSTPAYRSSVSTSRHTKSPRSLDADSDQSEADGSDHPMRGDSNGFTLHLLPTIDQSLANCVYDSTLSTPHLEMDLEQLFDYHGLQKLDQLDSLNTLHGNLAGSCDGFDLSDVQATDLHLSDELMLHYQSGTDNRTSSISSDAVSSVAEQQPLIFAAATVALHQPQMNLPIKDYNHPGQTTDTSMSCATLAHKVLNSLSKYSTFCSAQAPTQSRAGLSSYVHSLHIVDPSDLPVLPHGSLAHPDLKVFRIYACKSCGQKSTSQDIIGRHMATKHQRSRQVLDKHTDIMLCQSWTSSLSSRQWTVHNTATVTCPSPLASTSRVKEIHEEEMTMIARHQQPRVLDPSDTGLAVPELTSP
ncbi:hypothetical protein M436DRAFT_65669 [Aureobasidium namibiae CBS 147.97]|uniref:Zn(2)-C6 fungal-type domain-containing protein n=1 Tax=Aureobasidium namibiae CBS 147.97 TaxID=1043004 RepID=A0A074X893_9PEZI|nr:uncharacterized protein M436DRAFT_65669 [Aureobasidium namibiae CBS 147.97]KEQ70846.1 hypothetical protein M436DRAFT_65669 [Aureobasidium namibiae CBS 147.97]